MLSPPPSPLPFINGQLTSSLIRNQDCHHPQQQRPTKKLTGRRYTFIVILLPLALILITASLRHLGLMLDWNGQSLFSSQLNSRAKVLRHASLISLGKRQSVSPPPIFSNPLTFLPTPTSSTMPSSSVSAFSPVPTTAVPPVPTDPPSATGVVPTPFPQPFDMSLSLNFTTASCQNFFVSFTQSLDFRHCRPFSFLLGYSSGFIQAESNLSLLTNILWGTCNTVTPASDCQTLMTNMSQQLQSACKEELRENNALVNQALTGFDMYGPMRQTGCLVDESKGVYCFAAAVANPSPADLYFYQLPYGNNLPNDTVPSCSTCIKSVLGIYAQAVTSPSSKSFGTSSEDTADRSTSSDFTKSFNLAASIPLDHTYGPAANIAAQQCGSVYAQQVNVSAASPNAYSIWSLLSLLLCVAFPLLG